MLMDSEFPVNRIGWFFGDSPFAQNLSSLFSATANEWQEFSDTAVSFIFDSSDEDESADSDSIDAPITRLVQLLIKDAIDCRATQIRLVLLEDHIDIQYSFADGRSKAVDSPPRRLAGTLFAKIKELAGPSGEFTFDSQTHVNVEQMEAGAGFILSLQRAA
jgi:hypothetical protein